MAGKKNLQTYSDFNLFSLDAGDEICKTMSPKYKESSEQCRVCKT
jgi:hypothetical protein